ncbi:hypothetical protein DFAR_3850051 [Desulfarculales bacterium]
MRRVIGRHILPGLHRAVAFVTILAVVAGLALTSASTLSHDIFLNVVRKAQATEKEQVKVAKISTLIFGICTVLLGIPMQGPERSLHGGLHLCHRLLGQLPSALDIHRVEEIHHPERRVVDHHGHHPLGQRDHPEPHRMGGGSGQQDPHHPPAQPNHHLYDRGLRGGRNSFPDGA